MCVCVVPGSKGVGGREKERGGEGEKGGWREGDRDMGKSEERREGEIGREGGGGGEGSGRWNCPDREVLINMCSTLNMYTYNIHVYTCAP